MAGYDTQSLTAPNGTLSGTSYFQAHREGQLDIGESQCHEIV
jgi:hypothetical protein